MIEYVRCLDCKTIHRDGRLRSEWISGTVQLKGFCPECGADEFEAVSDVCDECERHQKVKDDDLCRNCLDAEKDALHDIATVNEVKQWTSEFRQLAIDMTKDPFKRTA